VTAARLAHVGARDAHPLVLSRSLDHATQQLAVARLELLLLAQRNPCPGNPPGKGVPQALELVEAHEPRPAGRRRHARVDLDAREGLARKAGQLALQSSDLATQLGAGEALAAAVDGPLAGDQRIAEPRPGGHPSFEHVRHPDRV
jgi:hypothetical protein